MTALRGPAAARRVREVALFLAAALLAAVAACNEVGPHDEGLVLQAGLRLADGQLPYRDFWWNYGPGLAVLQGAEAELLGSTLAAWRVVRVLVGAAVAVLAYRLARREGAREHWALLAGAAAGAAMAWPLTPGPTAYALALALGALTSTGTRFSGPLAGAAAWFRPELGVVAALGAGRAAWGPAALVAAVLYAPFVLAAPRDAFDDLLGFTSIQGLQRLPVPFDPSTDPNKLLEGTIVVVTLAAAVVALVSRMPLRLVPLLLASVAYLLARADEFHLVPLAVVVAIVLARRPRLAAVPLVLLVLHGLDRQAVRAIDRSDLAPVADGVRGDPRFVASVEGLRARLPPGPVFVAPPRFDQVRFGAPLVNVLLDRENPTRYDVIQPGVVTTGEVQREIVADLRRTRATVVRWVAPEARAREPNGAGRERGSTLADRVLAREWSAPVRVGDFLVLRYRSRRANAQDASATTPAR